MKIYADPKKMRRSRFVGWFAIVFAIGCLSFGFKAYICNWTSQRVAIWKWSLWAVWTVTVPLWQFFEYGRMYEDNTETEEQPDKRNCSLEEFKYMQDVASKFWLSVTAVLAALYAGPNILEKLGQ